MDSLSVGIVFPGNSRADVVPNRAQPSDLSLVIVTENDQPFSHYRLHGHSISNATAWIRSQISSLGADSSRYTLKRPYEIPTHAVAMGDDFDASDKIHFEELTQWFANGASTLTSFARPVHEASDVRMLA